MSANFCSSSFHSRTRDPLEPPPSAVIVNSPAKPPALPERIEAVLHLRELGHKVIRSPWGNREVLKEIAMSQDQNHLNHATWECCVKKTRERHAV